MARSGRVGETDYRAASDPRERHYFAPGRILISVIYETLNRIVIMNNVYAIPGCLGRNRFWLLAASISSLALGACDFDVTNPGPVQDDFLDDREAHRALVEGARMGVSLSLRLNAFYTAETSIEFFHVGTSTVPRLPIISGNLGEGAPSSWNATQQSRWVAEDAVRRMEEAVGAEVSTYAPAAEASLWAGYANRIAGDMMCDAVVDGGAPEPFSVYYERALTHFTRAIEIAGAAGLATTATAATAGRADIRAKLGDWAGAVSDASQVPNDFVFQAEYYSDIQDNHNRIAWSNANPGRTWSVYSTYYEDYYLQTGDPRVAWGRDKDFPFGDTSIRGERFPWWFGLKYTSVDDNKNLSSGREMRLLEAESELRAGNWEAGLGQVNALRGTVTAVDSLSGGQAQPIPAWEASNAEEAWSALKRERGIELWLEGRRLPDLRRWILEGTPGEMEDMTGRYLCFPISDAERETNPNVPMGPEFFHFTRP